MNSLRLSDSMLRRRLYKSDLTIQQLINRNKDHLSASHTPSLDALLILCHVLRLSKEQLYANLSVVPTFEEVARYNTLIDQRKTGTPVAYLTQQKEFYGLTFHVDPRVLIPRPDSETLVDWVLATHRVDSDLLLHDCCTGSGAIAITLKQAQPDWNITASDISIVSGEVFHLNWERLIGSVPVPWQQKNILRPQPTIVAQNREQKAVLPTPIFHIITANPPYLSSTETDNCLQQGWGEPAVALDGGSDGLKIVDQLILQAKDYLLPGGWLYLESADSQIDHIFAILNKQGFTDLEYKRDIAGMRRISRGKKG